MSIDKMQLIQNDKQVSLHYNHYVTKRIHFSQKHEITTFGVLGFWGFGAVLGGF